MRHWNEDHMNAIEAYADTYRMERNIAPTAQEIATGTQIPRSTVSRYLQHMTDIGRLSYSGYRHLETKASAKVTPMTAVPLLGRVSCGLLKDAVENIEEYIRIPNSWCGPGVYFALRANGDSMINIGISNGDIVIVRQQNTADPGQVVVALVDDADATLKRYYPSPDGASVNLVPENASVPVQTVDLTEHAFSIQGVAVKVIKDII